MQKPDDGLLAEALQGFVSLRGSASRTVSWRLHPFSLFLNQAAFAAFIEELRTQRGPSRRRKAISFLRLQSALSISSMGDG
jgi:hypothetical protein